MQQLLQPILRISTQYLTATLNQSWVGADYLAEVGYIRRKGYYEINPGVQYKFFPSSSRIANHGPVFKLDMLFDPSFRQTDRETQVSYQVEWMNKSSVKVDVKDTYVLASDSIRSYQYRWSPSACRTTITTGMKSVPHLHLIYANLLTLLVSSTLWGITITEQGIRLNGELYYRVQPYGSLAIVTSYNNISLPSPYNSAEFILFGPRLDLTFTENTLLYKLCSV